MLAWCLLMASASSAAWRPSGASEHAVEHEWRGALAYLALLPEFSLPKRATNCIDMAGMDTMRSACSKEEIEALADCTQRFFTRRPVLQSTPPRQNRKAARVLKASSDIEQSWRLILERRRLVEPRDTIPITNTSTLADMYTSWMHEWCAENLSSAYFSLHAAYSFFAAYLNNNCGAKYFVMGLWQTGVQWAPPLEMLRNDYSGALEHVAKNFAKWTQRLARAVTRHKNEAETVEERNRKERQDARVNYGWTVGLNRQIQAIKGKGKGKGKSGAGEHAHGTTAKGKGGKKGKPVTPELNEQWWLTMVAVICNMVANVTRRAVVV